MSKLFSQLLEFDSCLLSVSVSPELGLVGHPALWALHQLGPAVGADQVHLLTRVDGPLRRIQTNGALQVCLLLLDGLGQKVPHPAGPSAADRSSLSPNNIHPEIYMLLKL